MKYKWLNKIVLVFDSIRLNGSLDKYFVVRKGTWKVVMEREVLTALWNSKIYKLE